MSEVEKAAREAALVGINEALGTLRDRGPRLTVRSYHTMVAALQEAAAALRPIPPTPGEITQEQARAMRDALHKIAAFADAEASKRLEETGSFSTFDEPGSVQIARAALAGVPAP